MTVGEPRKKRLLGGFVIRARDPIFASASTLISHALAHSRRPTRRLLVRHYVVLRIEVAIFVLIPRPRLFRVFYQIPRAEEVTESEPHRHTGIGDRFIRIVLPAESEPMRYGEQGHLEANKGILNRHSSFVGRIASTKTRDRFQRNQHAEKETLPPTGEDDAFDTQKLRHRSEGLQIGVHAHPEERQIV